MSLSRRSRFLPPRSYRPENIGRFYLCHPLTGAGFLAIVSITMLFWLDRGLGPGRIIIFMSILGISLMVFEIPIGALVDGYSLSISLTVYQWTFIPLLGIVVLEAWLALRPSKPARPPVPASSRASVRPLRILCFHCCAPAQGKARGLSPSRSTAASSSAPRSARESGSPSRESPRPRPPFPLPPAALAHPGSDACTARTSSDSR